MKIGWNGGGHHRDLAAIREEARHAAEDGFASFWLSQITGPDALTAIAAIGSDAPGIELGTSIVPVYGRHPMVIAAQALTAQAATEGRLVLGIGASHQLIVEGGFGESYGRPFTRTKEVFRAVRGLVSGDIVGIEGKEVVARGQLAIDAPPCPILVAALGPRMLDLAGREADGTTLWMVGPQTVADHVVPRIREAASAADRPAPRVLAGVPVCITADADRARAHAAQGLAVYGQLPAYRQMLDAEGVDGPEGIVAIGSEDQVRERLATYESAGVTDLRVNALCPTPDEEETTRAFLRDIAATGVGG